ncbi:hypothetical protein JTB14_003911 [Gonioctena quinquepunctata]|nr:hypothetical protein JTB14_003911 [Gonioctena quinquepunctata]
MQQLSGKYVNVFLTVECGRGMSFLKNSVHITGNFNNRILESDKIISGECPSFNTELIWEVEKKELRKIRSANVPLRVECLTTDEYNRKERVGFTLLSLRSAQIISEKNPNQEVNFCWHRLIGGQSDKKKNHPELYISLSLRDFVMKDLEVTNSAEAMPYISEEDTNQLEDNSPEFPLKYFENGHIQIGEGSTGSSFTFNLLVKEVVNLDALLPEILVFQKNTGNYFISFKILGVTIKTKPFRRQLHSSITLNEKIVVTLLSKEGVLSEFFKTQSVMISFYCGRDKLGITKLEFDDVFHRNDLKCFFKFPSPNGIVPFGSTEKSPYIELQTWLEASPAHNLSDEEFVEKPKAKTIFSNISRKPDSSGDMPRSDTEKIHKERTKDNNDDTMPRVENNPSESFTAKSMNTLIKNDPLSARLPGPMDNYMNVKIGYLSTPCKIGKLLKCWAPKLVLADENEKLICKKQTLNVSCLNESCMEYETTLHTFKEYERLAKVGVSITIKQCDMEETDDYHLHLLPVVIDEIVTVKEISDLQKWKQLEKKRFDEELAGIKQKEIEELEEEWGKKKEELEEKLTKTINKCKYLQEDLMEKMNGIKTDKILKRRRNNSNIYEGIFRENWKNYSSNNSKELIEVLSKTERDNELLKEICDEQRQKLSQLEKSTLTKTQTTNLLQELRVLEQKFEDAQMAKGYFKDQWKRACEEIHELKTEDMKNMQIQIKKSKEKLSQLSLEKYSEYEREECDELYEINNEMGDGHFF